MDDELKPKSSVEPPSPTEDELVKALMEIDEASNRAPAAAGLPNDPPTQLSWISTSATIGIFSVTMLAAIGLLVWGIQRAVRGSLSSTAESSERTGGAGQLNRSGAA